MRRLLALAGVLAGCGFHGPTLDVLPDRGDGGANGSACVPGFLDLCAQPAPAAAFEVTKDDLVNTDVDTRCLPQGQGGGGAVCLIYATSVAIQSGATLSATGTRPLAIASMTTLVVDGAIDVGSHAPLIGAAADGTGCTFAAAPATDVGGGGGGAGGSFVQPGGDGGTGDNNNNGDPPGTAAPGRHGEAIAASVLRGGCAGQTGGNETNGAGTGKGGTGGHSGGAVYLFARQSVGIAGSIRATGAGGRGGEGMAGAGGGGSGGMVVVESPQIMIGGQISANGGGGGQGGGLDLLGTTRVSGDNGDDGVLGSTGAPGGSDVNDARFGRGGAGGALVAAGAGTAADYGGGGGGGAPGVVLVLGASQVTGVISPAPASP